LLGLSELLEDTLCVIRPFYTHRSFFTVRFWNVSSFYSSIKRWVCLYELS